MKPTQILELCITIIPFYKNIIYNITLKNETCHKEWEKVERWKTCIWTKIPKGEEKSVVREKRKESRESKESIAIAITCKRPFFLFLLFSVSLLWFLQHKQHKRKLFIHCVETISMSFSFSPHKHKSKQYHHSFSFYSLCVFDYIRERKWVFWNTSLK